MTHEPAPEVTRANHAMKKYYIRKTNRQTGKVEYKRYKCSDGFCQNKYLCWQFSRQGALKIIDRLKNEYRANIVNLEFDLEEC